MLRLACALLALSVLKTAAQTTGGAGFLTRAEAAATRLPPPPACTLAQAGSDGRVQRHALPGRIMGAAAGTTGGLGRTLYLVRSAEEGSASQEGTLRWALAAARRDGGGWIAFAPALSAQTIQLSSGLRITSNITLDGGCGGVVLRAPAHSTTLLIADATNVIVSGLTFSKTEYSEPDDRIADAIGLRDGFDRVALLNNAFTRCGDGCIDIVRREISPAVGRVTVAFNRIENHNKVMLVGTLICTPQRWREGCERPLERLGDVLRPTIRVTLVGNVFLGTSQRHPKVVAGAFVHSVNNLLVLGSTTYSDGRDSATYGAIAASGGVLASEGDIVVNPTASARVGIGPVSAQRSAAGEAREADGSASVAGMATVGPVRSVSHMPELAQAQLAAEPAAVRPRVATNDPTTLAACLLRGAGPPGAALDWLQGCPSMGVNMDGNLGQSTRAVTSRSR